MATSVVLLSTAYDFYNFLDNKKTCRYLSAGPFVAFNIENKKAKGEEKPEEELMGKCKSSPCFETTKLTISCLNMLLWSSKQNIYM
ncbi:heptaprenyl diphosphate synthase subunit I [Oceanobacillus picturae]|uniref:Heptaprenyl diphosphate synthase subunit I n=1 Tax=Oceanobacillus picturae TaxID=171693 RepID=A0A0U9HC02_9BACI|nr:heptaprenyl diphosphate synthase subunit I [Oceanobacillus picturae]